MRRNNLASDGFFPPLRLQWQLPCVVRDRLFINPHFVIRDAGTLRWFAGLPAAFRGRTLEAVKPDRGDPPAIHVQVWRGLHGQRGVTFLFLHRFAQKSKGDFSVLSRLFSRILTKFPLKLFPPSCKINLQSMTDSCNEVLRARAETITPAETLTFRASDSLGASFLFA